MSTERPPLKPVYGIWGEDRGKVEPAIHRLVQRVTDEGGLPPDEFDAANDVAPDVVGVCETLSFGGRRLVIVRNVHECKAGDVAALLTYLESPSPDTCLALLSAGPPTPKLVAAIGEQGERHREAPGDAGGLDALQRHVLRHVKLAHAVLVHRGIRGRQIEPPRVHFREMRQHLGRRDTVLLHQRQQPLHDIGIRCVRQ